MEEITTLSFPNEIMVDILSRLNNTNLVNCYEVCPRWKELIDRAVGFALFIGGPWKDEDNWKSGKWVQHDNVEAISLYGAKECYLAKEPLVSLSTGECPKFKCDTMLRRLWLDTQISPISFVMLTKPLSNLRKLSFHVSTLSVLLLKNLPVPFELLRHFEISMFTVQDEIKLNIDMVLDNVLSLMEVPETFKYLTSLALNLPYHTQRCKSITDAVRNFIVRHKRTLRKVIVSLEDSDGGLAGPVPVSTRQEAITQDLRGLRLSSFTLHSALASGGQMAGLRAIMERQLHLTSLFSTTGYEPFSRLSQTISACARTLTQVQMAVGPDNVGLTGVNLMAFEDCKSLKVLALLGPSKVDENPNPFEQDEDEIDGRMLTADIVGANYLSDKLQVIKIYNLFLLTADTKLLVSKPALRILYLKNIGRYGGLGLLYLDAMDLFSKQTLKSFSLGQCINVISLPTTLSSTTDPLTFFNAILIRHILAETFSAHLSETGDYYIPGNSSTESHVLDHFSNEFVLTEHVFTLEEDSSDEEDDEEAEDEAEHGEQNMEVEAEVEDEAGDEEEAEDEDKDEAEDMDDEADDETDDIQDGIELGPAEGQHFAVNEHFSDEENSSSDEDDNED